MELLAKVLEAITGLTWVSSTQSYRLNGPPGAYSSAEVRVSRGCLCPIPESTETLNHLHELVLRDCKSRMPDTMHSLVEMVEEHTPE